MTRSRLAFVCGVSCLLLATSARSAHAGAKECIAAADEGQKLRDDGKLTAAREKFIACAAKTCPGPVAKQCSQWLLEADQNAPSVTFRALDEQGKETMNVKVSIDGVTVATAIEARALPVDPGEHTVRFELPDGRALEDKVLLRQGEKNRMIELSFQPKAPAVVTPPSAVTPQASEEKGFQVPLLGWVGLGVGVVGGVMTVVFALSANSAESDLRTSCAPSCPSSEKSGIDTKIVLANIGLGVGLVGLGVGVVATILANTGSKAAPPAASSAPKAAARRSIDVDVAPGAVLLRGAF